MLKKTPESVTSYTSVHINFAMAKFSETVGVSISTPAHESLDGVHEFGHYSSLDQCTLGQ